MQQLQIPLMQAKTLPFHPLVGWLAESSASTESLELPLEFDVTLPTPRPYIGWLAPSLPNLSAWRDFDQSSVYPESHTRDQMSVTKCLDTSEDDIVAALVESDYVVRMPPRRDYRVTVRVRSVSRGEPVFSEIE